MIGDSKTLVEGAAVDVQPALSSFERSPTLAPQSATISATGLTKIYESGSSRVVVFEDLRVEVAAGEMVAIVGPSGAGKSTLLHLLGGLDRPTSGAVKVAEFDISKLGDVDLARFRNREIGFIFQFHHLLPEFSAVENVMMPLLISRSSSSAARERALSLLEAVGLGTRATHRPGELSGGEQARVALARALVARPRILLADEPTGDLDSKTSESIHSLFKEVHGSQRLTSVIVTHNERLAAICDRVLHLEDGQLRNG
ncbi:MAG TPA: ABC transporter ATP-binding protein [Blastocatellia bacterium]|nr:ABC transporter ATP-binding protein [Blastocatellia bacterium]